MSYKNVHNAIKECETANSPRFSAQTSDWLTPSYIVTMAAFAKKHDLKKSDVDFKNKNHHSYLETIGFYNALWHTPYQRSRHNAGSSYAVLTLLEDDLSTDSANTQILSCIDQLVDRYESPGITMLKNAIGEVHDNVWSHGKSTGFSMAQKYNGSIEFALSDLGGGFLKELNRVNLNISTHQAAIEWCIQKGNSSKLIESKHDDGWGQSLPYDAISNPMGKFAKYTKENNHAGLGLDTLIKVIQQYNGKLKLITGNCELSISPSNSTICYSTINTCWHGVTIMCQLNVEELKKNDQEDDESDLREILSSLID